MQVKDNTKCSSTEVLWEKRSTIVFLWVEIPTPILSVVLGLYYRLSPLSPRKYDVRLKKLQIQDRY